MASELRLGVCVLANTMEHAQDAAQAATSILLPAFEALLRFFCACFLFCFK